MHDDKGSMLKRELISNEIKSSIIGFGGASISGEGAGYGFGHIAEEDAIYFCLLYTSPSPRDQRGTRMPSSA